MAVPVSSEDLQIMQKEEGPAEQAKEGNDEAQEAEKPLPSIDDLSVAWHAVEWLKTKAKKDVFAGNFYIEVIAHCCAGIYTFANEHIAKIKLAAAPLIAQGIVDKCGRVAKPDEEAPTTSMWYEDFAGTTWEEFEKHASDTLMACDVEAVKANWLKLRGLWCDAHAINHSFALKHDWPVCKEVIDELQKIVWAGDLMKLYGCKTTKPALIRTKTKTIVDDMKAKGMQADALGLWIAKRMKAAMKLQKL